MVRSAVWSSVACAAWLLACSAAPRRATPRPPAAASYLPPGHRELSAALNVPDLEAVLPFYERAMGAQVLQRLHGPDGKLRSARVHIGGDSVLLLMAEDADHRSPAAVGGSPLRLYMYVEDVDAAFAGALAAGAKVQQPLQNLFWGDRGGQIRDPAGYVWYLATHVEDISNQEFARRSQQAIDTFARGEVPKWTLQHTASRWRPDGYATVTPIAIVRDIDQASNFARAAFGATVVRHVADSTGSSIHAELRIGESFLRLSKEYEQYQHDSPFALGGHRPAYTCTSATPGRPASEPLRPALRSCIRCWTRVSANAPVPSSTPPVSPGEWRPSIVATRTHS
jgi:PhnB protein